MRFYRFVVMLMFVVKMPRAIDGWLSSPRVSRVKGRTDDNPLQTRDWDAVTDQLKVG